MRTHRGFSLLEVAVATVIAGIGLAGVCALLIRAATDAASLSDQATAAWLAQRLAAELTLTPGLLPAVPAVASAPPECTPLSPCAASVFASGNLALWRADVSGALPSGHGLVCRDGTPNDGEPRQSACDGEGGMVIKLLWRRAGSSTEWARHVLGLQP